MCTHVYCSDCQYSDKGLCKRLKNEDGFAKPFFKCEYFSAHVICSDFKPKGYLKAFIATEWTNFEEYFPKYIEEWLPYKNTNILLWFTIDGDTSVRYGVPFWDFVYNRHYEGDKLKYVAKRYYKQTKNGFGYKLITEYL